MNRYMFTALFEPGEVKGFTVSFPELPGCITEGDDFEEAAVNAKEALELHLYGMEEEGIEFPKPSAIPKMDSKPIGAFVVITAWMDLVREEMRNKAVKKTLTIPMWLNEEAEKQNINFSQVLQEALKKRVGAKDSSDS